MCVLDCELLQIVICASIHSGSYGSRGGLVEIRSEVDPVVVVAESGGDLTHGILLLSFVGNAL